MRCKTCGRVLEEGMGKDFCSYTCYATFCRTKLKEEPMNTVKMILASGNHKFTKTIEMTDIMVQDCADGRTLSVLDMDMHITTFELDSTPKWNMHILFEYAHNQTEVSLEEYDRLMDEGWVREK